MILLWLDDIRNPADQYWHRYFPVPDPDVVWCKSYEEFIEWISANSLPVAICFDHDLGEGANGYDAAKWLVEYCLDHQLKLPKWAIQSSNPVGKQNIASLLESFERATYGSDQG